MFQYNFGVYHWRERLQVILSAVVIIMISLFVGQRSSSRLIRLVAAVGIVGAIVRGTEAAQRMLSPRPWALEEDKYDALANRLPFGGAERALDIGCGTGRSLAGFAPSIPDSCTVVGLDIFDSRIIFGNAPGLARRNGRHAGIDVTPVIGDASCLPMATDSVDVVTACRVLHDLPTTDAKCTLREAHRVCEPDGALGVLELPILPHDATETTASPVDYWRERVAEAGFTVETLGRLDQNRRNGQYVLIVATP